MYRSDLVVSWAHFNLSVLRIGSSNLLWALIVVFLLNFKTFIIFLWNIYFMYICLVFCLDVCRKRPEEHVRSYGAGVTDRFELPNGCWELKLTLQEQPVILTTEPYLHPLLIIIKLWVSPNRIWRAGIIHENENYPWRQLEIGGAMCITETR